MTEFVAIPGYEGFYEVGDDGTIRSLDRIVYRSDTGKPLLYTGCVLQPSRDKYGYLNVYLSVNRKSKRFRVHRLVAEAFVQNPMNKRQVNHKDGNKENNHKDNLEWSTNQENQKHAIDTGLKTIHTGRKAARLLYTTFVISAENEIIHICNGNKELEEAGFDFRLVSDVCLGKRRSHRGCTFLRIKVEDSVE